MKIEIDVIIFLRFRGYSSVGRASRSQEDFRFSAWFSLIWTHLDWRTCAPFNYVH